MSNDGGSYPHSKPIGFCDVRPGHGPSQTPTYVDDTMENIMHDILAELDPVKTFIDRNPICERGKQIQYYFQHNLLRKFEWGCWSADPDEDLALRVDLSSMFVINNGEGEMDLYIRFGELISEGICDSHGRAAQQGAAWAIHQAVMASSWVKSFEPWNIPGAIIAPEATIGWLQQMVCPNTLLNRLIVYSYMVRKTWRLPADLMRSLWPNISQLASGLAKSECISNQMLDTTGCCTDLRVMNEVKESPANSPSNPRLRDGITAKLKLFKQNILPPRCGVGFEALIPFLGNCTPWLHYNIAQSLDAIVPKLDSLNGRKLIYRPWEVEKFNFFLFGGIASEHLVRGFCEENHMDPDVILQQIGKIEALKERPFPDFNDILDDIQSDGDNSDYNDRGHIVLHFNVCYTSFISLILRTRDVVAIKVLKLLSRALHSESKLERAYLLRMRLRHLWSTLYVNFYIPPTVYEWIRINPWTIPVEAYVMLENTTALNYDDLIAEINLARNGSKKRRRD